MCHQVQCEICGKPTWEGCGKHVEQALADVPVPDRCPGHSDDEIAQHAAQQRAATGSGKGAFRRLFARN